MANLNRQRLRSIIQLEMKKLMDEDALFMQRKIPGDYDDDVVSFQMSQDSIDNEEECQSCSSKNHSSPCTCPACSDKRVGIYESCGCGGEASSSYEEDYDSMQRSAHVDPMIDDLLGMGAEKVDIDWKDEDDHNRHSSYMARPQLAKIAKYASQLLDIVDKGEQLEDWQESKIAQMSQMMGDVYHSIEYDEMEMDHDDLNVHDLLGMIRTSNI
jgi:hypothetical protein